MSLSLALNPNKLPFMLVGTIYAPLLDDEGRVASPIRAWDVTYRGTLVTRGQAASEAFARAGIVHFAREWTPDTHAAGPMGGDEVRAIAKAIAQALGIQVVDLTQLLPPKDQSAQG